MLVWQAHCRLIAKRLGWSVFGGHDPFKVRSDDSHNDGGCLLYVHEQEGTTSEKVEIYITKPFAKTQSRESTCKPCFLIALDIAIRE